MKKIIFFACLLISTKMFSQLPDGSIAPDFTGYDINGQPYSLYDILASEKDVIIDFFFTSCNPCWIWHNSGILEELYQEVGPEGTNEAVILMIESLPTTDINAIYGIGSGTLGDWTENTSYPILELSNVAETYKINSFPTILKICQDRRIEKINGIRNLGVSFGIDELNECPNLDYSPEPFFDVNKNSGCGSLEIQFEDHSWPIPTSWLWDFGDGNTSTEQLPLHFYELPGEYTVSLIVTNEFGENQMTKPNLIKIGEGEPHLNQIVGGVNSGSGYYKESLNKRLIFDAYDDLIISSVKVYSMKDQARTIVLRNNSGTIIESKVINIPVGEHRVELNFFVPMGQDFQLGFCSERFLRIDSISNYPYVLENLISIKKGSGSSPNEYYYFYEWEVRPVSCILSTSSLNPTLESPLLYPNPSNRILNISHTEAMQTEISIFNVSGQKCEFTTTYFDDYSQLDISKLQDGVYFIEIPLGQKITRTKFIKVR